MRLFKNIMLSLSFCGILLYNHCVAQDSSHLRISLLTCTPGAELYSTFGHSALRVVDSSSVTDFVYNYGTFNFDDEGFYIKFARGKLMYYISIEKFQDFRSFYQEDNRGMIEQVLGLSAVEKINIQHALNENLKEENKYYKYDFFLDNCTTRLRDMIVKARSPQPILPNVMPVNTKFRQAIHQYLDKNKKYWSKLGIDILLGAPTDAVMTTSQQQFLPDNLMKALDSCKNVRIVTTSKNLYPLAVQDNSTNWFTPMFFFCVLLGVFILLGCFANKKIQALLNGLDGLLFFSTGVLGIILILMWTATDHSMTKNNYNLLWAWPTHTIISFFVNSKKNWVKKYFLINTIVLIILLLAWFFLPQQMNNALIPFVLLLVYRSCIKFLNQ